MLLRSSIAPILSLTQKLEDIELQNSIGSKKRSHVPCSNVLSIRIKERNEGEVGQHKYLMKAKPSTQKLFLSNGFDGEMGSNIGGGRGSDGRGWNLHEENNDRDRTEAYYQNMIDANPGDALLLGNYAKFLKEVCGDYAKAEEYLERAILANPDDGHNLSIYADLIWQTEKNADRAEGYFDQAIISAPDDSYALASYAKFLWDVEDEEDLSHVPPTPLFQETNNGFHLTAAS